MDQKLTRKQLDKLIEDIKTARLFLTIVLSDAKIRKEISEKLKISYSYLSDFVILRKKISDSMVIKILDKWVE